MRTALEPEFATEHKQLPTRGGSWAEFQVRNKASRTAANFKS